MGGPHASCPIFKMSQVFFWLRNPHIQKSSKSIDEGLGGGGGGGAIVTIVSGSSGADNFTLKKMKLTKIGGGGRP